MDDAALEKALLLAVSAGDVESDAFASANGADHKKVVGLLKSLESSELVRSAARDHGALKLAAEAQAYLTQGTPEAQAFAAVPPGAGVPLADFKKLDKTISDIGFKQAMQQKWLAMEKGEVPMVVRKADAVEDTARKYLEAINAGDVASVPPKELDALVKKRKLVKQETWKTFTIGKGAKFALERKKAAADLTKEMLQDGSWRDAEFKQYNLVPGAGAPPNGGCALRPAERQNPTQCRQRHETDRDAGEIAGVGVDPTAVEDQCDHWIGNQSRDEEAPFAQTPAQGKNDGRSQPAETRGQVGDVGGKGRPQMGEAIAPSRGDHRYGDPNHSFARMPEYPIELPPLREAERMAFNDQVVGKKRPRAEQ